MWSRNGFQPKRGGRHTGAITEPVCHSDCLRGSRRRGAAEPPPQCRFPSLTCGGLTCAGGALGLSVCTTVLCSGDDFTPTLQMRRLRPKPWRNVAKASGGAGSRTEAAWPPCRCPVNKRGKAGDSGTPLSTISLHPFIIDKSRKKKKQIQEGIRMEQEEPQPQL